MDELIRIASEKFNIMWLDADCIYQEGWKIHIGGETDEGVSCDFTGFGEDPEEAKQDVLKQIREWR